MNSIDTLPADNKRFSIKSFSVVEIIGGSIAVLFFLLAIVYHFNLLTSPYQLELREVAMYHTTYALRDSVDIYATKNLPEYLNLFGIVYNLIVLPFTYLPVDMLVLHRVITAIFLLGVVAIFYVVQKRLGVSRWLSIPSSALIYLIFLYGVIPVPRPDTLGTFIFSFALAYPFLKRYSFTSLLISAVLSVLAFYTKLYFAIAFPIVALYVFMFISKRNAIVASIIYFVLLVVSIVTINHFSPNYFTCVVLVSDNSATYTHEMIYIQVRDFFLLQATGYFLLFIALCFLIAARTVKNITNRSTKLFQLPALNIRNINVGLLNASLAPSLFFVIAVIDMFLFAIKLGGHGGSYMTYFIEIFSPFFIVEMNRRLIANKMNAYVVLAAVFFSSVMSYRFLNGVADDYSGFRKAESIIKSHTNPLCYSAMGSILLKNNKHVDDNGLFGYYRHAWYVKSKLMNKFFDVDSNKLKAYNQYVTNIQQNVLQKKYDVVLMPVDEYYPMHLDSMLAVSYDVKDSLVLSMPQYYNERYVIYVSEPKP